MARILTSQRIRHTPRRNRVALIVSLFVGAMPLLSGCTDEINTLPVDDFTGPDSQAVSEAFMQTEPTIIHTGRPYQKTDSGDRYLASFVLVNPLNVPIEYYGYRMDSFSERPPAGEIHPFYALQIMKHGDDQWQDGNMGYCGTGADTMVVNPRQAGRFQAHMPLGEGDCRISVSCSWGDNEVSMSKVCSSPTISLSSASPSKGITK